eukprot:COSAG01_NODE_6366_length_3710_cov_255.589864_4_plen_194_part_00
MAAARTATVIGVRQHLWYPTPSHRQQGGGVERQQRWWQTCALARHRCSDGGRHGTAHKTGGSRQWRQWQWHEQRRPPDAHRINEHDQRQRHTQDQQQQQQQWKQHEQRRSSGAHVSGTPHTTPPGRTVSGTAGQRGSDSDTVHSAARRTDNDDGSGSSDPLAAHVGRRLVNEPGHGLGDTVGAALQRLIEHLH